MTASKFYNSCGERILPRKNKGTRTRAQTLKVTDDSLALPHSHPSPVLPRQLCVCLAQLDARCPSQPAPGEAGAAQSARLHERPLACLAWALTRVDSTERV